MEKLVIEILFQAGLDRELGRVLIGGELRADNYIGGAVSVPKFFDGNQGLGRTLVCSGRWLGSLHLGRIIECGEVASRA